MFHSSFGSINEILASLLLGQVNNWLASFFQKFYGREEGFYFYYFFDSEVLMLKYNKTYPYLLSFLHPSVTTFAQQRRSRGLITRCSAALITRCSAAYNRYLH